MHSFRGFPTLFYAKKKMYKFKGLNHLFQVEGQCGVGGGGEARACHTVTIVSLRYGFQLATS